MPSVDIKLKLYQDSFIFAEEDFCCLVGAVGTGKTFAYLFKAWDYCSKNPNSLGLIVRKEFADLKDSTIKDFENYFGVKINQANKEYTFSNGSTIMFRHGNKNDINVLKNINLSFFLIEQAEEYENEDVWDFLKDRLRRKGGRRWAGLVANANGHNWIFKTFINGADIKVVDRETGQFEYRTSKTVEVGGEEIDVRTICCTANTFANADNLPVDFLARLKAMEGTTHYYQYVMNSFDYTESDDLLFSMQDFEPKIGGKPTGQKIIGFDVARMGQDKCAVKIIEYYGSNQWKEAYSTGWKKQKITYSCGRVLEIAKEHGVSMVVVDGDGLGAGAVDMLQQSRLQVIEYRGGMNPCVDYFNNRARDYFSLLDAVQKGYLDVCSEESKESLLTVKYTFQGDKQKRIVGKNEMRAKGYDSPDDADALMMAYSGTKYFIFSQNGNSRFGGNNCVTHINSNFDPFD